LRTRFAPELDGLNCFEFIIPSKWSMDSALIN
jgi:hypothetical protein